MSKPVLFVTGLGSELHRAENMKCLYDAYPGEKKFVSINDGSYSKEAYTGKYSLIVIDIFPTEHPMKTIMMWHSIQGGKYIGLDERRTYYHESYARFIDAIITAGYGGSEMFHRCTKVPMERIFDLGMPRTDRYKRKRKGDGHTALAEKRAYLFAPTYRGFNDSPPPMIDWEWLDEHLTDDEILAVKPHPYDGFRTGVEGCRHIIEIPRMEASVNYLYDADVVITDYSSIIFDGYLLKKPAVLFEKDMNYHRTRGMYLPYPDGYCSRLARNERELLEHLRSAKRLRTAERKCLDYVADACDGHSIERICAFIDEMKG